MRPRQSTESPAAAAAAAAAAVRAVAVSGEALSAVTRPPRDGLDQGPAAAGL